MTKNELSNLISDTVNDLYDVNENHFKENMQIMTPFASKLSVLATLKILQEHGIFPKTED